ncbi:hypothetical protein [Shewanella xiamenensis]|uniref:hypothetical protein n=1 Tax=Shewanella xiamenensis TaxID=332186 RepID=UPI00217D07E6|nr:hypothetical protein [Shewanella xiamenensis]MCT8874154.1 hypothetical protein [Shewanella xiamenensis]UWH42825.1 hypothetical protein KXJ80_06080 [Shewanella xiamenensis]
MDRKSFVLLACVAMGIPSFSAVAAVYKCADGKYQADPCDETSKPVDLSNVGSVVASGSTAGGVDYGKRQEISAYIDNQRISREITKLESDRKRVIERRDQRMRDLQNGRRYANNNLAGATWQQSLAQEMAAVAQQADTQVASIDRQIEQLKSEKK